MIYLNDQTASDEAFPPVGDRGLFSTFLDLRLGGSVRYLVDPFLFSGSVGI